jgi:transcriptional regulator with XRE-family HTH domain
MKVYAIILKITKERRGTVMEDLGVRTGKNIRKYRILNNITLVELSQKTGIPLQSLYRYESGTTLSIKIDKLMAIADALNVNVNQLTEWNTLGDNKIKGEVDILNSYNQLSPSHKKAVSTLIDSLIEAQTCNISQD